MARALWSGSISFGLVNIPVKMYPATQDKGIHFHQIDSKTKCRVHHKLFCPGRGEISPSDITKGYEIAPDQYIIVDKKELEALEPEKGQAIEITEFVDLASIDPLYYDRPYYLLPDKAAAKAYRLLVTAMSKSAKVGIAKFVMRNKEYVAALRPIGDVMCIEIMRFADELVSTEQLEAPTNVEVGDKELKMAQHLIESLTEDFQPEKYHDDYSEKVKELIDRKAQGKEIVTEPPATKAEGKVISLMAALEKSLKNASKKKRETKTASSKSRKRKAS
jgi:DNA end-binding protein Ku